MAFPLRHALLFGLPLLGAVAVTAHPATGAGDLGTVHFASTGAADIQARVTRGVKLLHHMMYVEADREFAAVVAADPDNGFGYWGRAMALVHPLWPDVPVAADLARGRAFVAAGAARPLRSERERAYLGTMAAFFADESQRTLPARLQAAEAAWAELAARYPTDLDAAAFAALYHLAPARFLPRDKSHRIQLEAAAALERILAQIPDHPGALHYKIHAYDFPLLAGRALEVCDSYGEIAPDVPHALHMPTHIFTRQGSWEKSIDFNERSAAAARTLIRADGTINSHLLHALDYLAYAYLQRGQYQRAAAVARELAGLNGPFQPVNRATMAYAFAAIPARIALERQDWAAAAQLPLRQPAGFPWNESFVYCDALVRFARGLGAARAGQLDAARTELDELEKTRDAILAVIPGSYWAAQGNAQVLAVRGWLRLREGHRDEAVALLRQAVAVETSTDKEAVTPGEVLPTGEMLGDLLLEINQPRDALAAYTAQLELTPHRLNAVYGAACAARDCGDDATAVGRFNELLALTTAADPGNPRVPVARQFVEAHATTAKL